MRCNSRIRTRRSAGAWATVFMLAGCALAGIATPGSAHACARDGVPSISADGRLAQRTRSTQGILPATWTPFYFGRAALPDRAVTLSENNREVARTLPRDVFSRPWRWTFGDGSAPAYGTSVRHVYRKGGTYRIVVLAYYRSYGSWLAFDDATIRVR